MLVQASIQVARSSPWVVEAVLVALGGHGEPWTASVGIDLLASIQVARSSPTWGCRISEVLQSRVTLQGAHNLLVELKVEMVTRVVEPAPLGGQ
jgi:hypothetical protein